MPPHTYERIPLDEQTLPRDNHYFSGIPSTAPPSFHTVPSNTHFPHRYDETVATVIPQNERPSPIRERTDNEEADEPAISLWSSSEHSLDTAEHRDELILKLLNRVELLEERLESQSRDKTEVDIEAQRDPYAEYRTSPCANLAIAIASAVFMIWFMGTLTLDVWVGHTKKASS